MIRNRLEFLKKMNIQIIACNMCLDVIIVGQNLKDRKSNYIILTVFFMYYLTSIPIIQSRGQNGLRVIIAKKTIPFTISVEN